MMKFFKIIIKGGVFKEFVIITTSAEGELKNIHNRMPFFIEDSNLE